MPRPIREPEGGPGSGRYEGRPIGIPYTVVSRRTPRRHVRFTFASESDRVGDFEVVAAGGP